MNVSMVYCRLKLGESLAAVSSFLVALILMKLSFPSRGPAGPGQPGLKR